MIYETNNVLLIPKILEIAKSIPGFNVMNMDKMLIEGLTSHNSKVFISEKSEEINGFIYASVENWQGEDVAFIQACATKGDGDTQGLLSSVKAWAKVLGLSSLVMITRRDPKPFERKYKFSYEGAIMRRNVNG